MRLRDATDASSIRRSKRDFEFADELNFAQRVEHPLGVPGYSNDAVSAPDTYTEHAGQVPRAPGSLHRRRAFAEGHGGLCLEKELDQLVGDRPGGMAEVDDVLLDLIKTKHMSLLL
jgi:hypothetical protein